MRRRLCFLLSMCALLFVGACGGSPNDGFTTSEAGSKISIVSPKEGAKIDIDELTVDVKIDGQFDLVRKFGEQSREGEGHIVFYAWNGFFDGTRYAIPNKPGDVANAGGVGYVASSSHETTYAWNHSTVPGRQALAVQLVNNDFTPLDPPQIDRIVVELTGERKQPDRDEDD